MQGVARRLALHARGEIARRRRREVQASSFLHAPECPVSVFGDEVERQEARRMIDAAVDELPEKYRAPLVLCYLEGMTNHEAARQLGYPVGSISRRLERARGLLKKQLIGHGVTLSLIVGVGLLAALALLRPAVNRTPREVKLEPVRVAMTLLEPESSPQFDLRKLVVALERKNDSSSSVPDRDRLGRLAKQSARVAETVAALDPGGDRDVWRAYAGEMKLAALELSRGRRRRPRGRLARERPPPERDLRSVPRNLPLIGTRQSGRRGRETGRRRGSWIE